MLSPLRIGGKAASGEEEWAWSRRSEALFLALPIVLDSLRPQFLNL